MVGDRTVEGQPGQFPVVREVSQGTESHLADSGGCSVTVGLRERSLHFQALGLQLHQGGRGALRAAMTS